MSSYITFCCTLSIYLYNFLIYIHRNVLSTFFSHTSSHHKFHPSKITIKHLRQEIAAHINEGKMRYVMRKRNIIIQRRKKKYFCYQNIAANRYTYTHAYEFLLFFTNIMPARFSLSLHDTVVVVVVIVSEEDTKILQTAIFLSLPPLYVISCIYCLSLCVDFHLNNEEECGKT